MKSKPIIPRELANRDIDAAIQYYMNEGSESATLGFINSLQKTYVHIGCHPTTGSPRYAHELGLPGLRFCPMKRYSYLVFYIEREEYIDVWRVLHSQRDIPTWMHEPGES